MRESRESYVTKQRSHHLQDDDSFAGELQRQMDREACRNVTQIFLTPPPSVKKQDDLNFHDWAKHIADKLTQTYPNISMSSEVLGGAARIKGTRISVARVLSAVSEHGSIKAAVADYDDTYTVKQFEDAILYARDFLTTSLSSR